MAASGLAFLSYAHDNLNQVREVYNGLRKRGVNVWFDKENLKIGRWKPQILKTISRSQYFIICLSDAAIKKTSGENPGFQDEELQIAWEFAREQDERGITIIPVRLENCDRGDMRLSGWQQYDLFEDWESVLDKLAVNLGGNSLSDATAQDERMKEKIMCDNLIGKGVTFYYLGDYTKALSIFEAAINIQPHDAGYWSNKGNALSALGRYQEALEAFEKAIEIQPDLHPAWSNKGITLRDLGRLQEALEAYEKAIEIQPNLHQAWSNKGNALGDLGRHREALEAYEKAIEIQPDFYQAWYNKGNALRDLGRHQEALEACEKAIEIQPDDHEAWSNKGIALSDLGRHREALEACEKAIEIQPCDADCWYNYACFYTLKKEKDNALSCLRKAVEYGYNNLSHIKKDKDLDFIRNEPEFNRIIENL